VEWAPAGAGLTHGTRNAGILGMIPTTGDGARRKEEQEEQEEQETEIKKIQAREVGNVQSLTALMEWVAGQRLWPLFHS